MNKEIEIIARIDDEIFFKLFLSTLEMHVATFINAGQIITNTNMSITDFNVLVTLFGKDEITRIVLVEKKINFRKFINLSHIQEK